ncbi:MAG: hypothetical protein K2O18_14860 [Oscillospiraceae bacterium]|nr:hypothetical protein [Oscillospiraceae bacterium]
MDILIGKRQEGKTTHLIQMSAAGHGTIVAPTEQSVNYIKEQAKVMKLDIPEPISWRQLNRIGGGGYGGGPYLLDELGEILRELSVKTAILDDECVIANLSSNVVHYGDELAAKIRENTKDFSKLSDFDQYVLNNGYRYKTREELYAGYERHWKAAHDILVTMDEFLIEADKKKSDPAAYTYKALVNLVEVKKLRPGEVLNYARFRWCLNNPEAVIDYKIGRDKWAVNNCDTEITADEARIKVCEEWGFETGRTHIFKTPYYNATDYQFIRFTCAHMTWLWQNGSLYQVYC